MFKKYLVLSLIALILNLSGGGLVFAQTKPDDKNPELTQKIKTGIANLGTGTVTQVKLELRDKTKLKGFVSKIEDDSFTVMDAKTGSATKVLYTDVNKISGKNHSTGFKIAVIAAIAVPVTILLLLVRRYYCNEQAC